MLNIPKLVNTWKRAVDMKTQNQKRRKIKESELEFIVNIETLMGDNNVTTYAYVYDEYCIEIKKQVYYHEGEIREDIMSQRVNKTHELIEYTKYTRDEINADENLKLYKIFKNKPLPTIIWKQDEYEVEEFASII